MRPPKAILPLSLCVLLVAARSADAADSAELLRRRAEAFVAAMNAEGRAGLEAFARDHLQSRVAREGLTPRFVSSMEATREELGPIERHSVQVLRDGHGGMAPGTHFELKVYPERDTVMVVMSNYNTIAGPETASALDHLIRNPPLAVTPSASSTSGRTSSSRGRPR